MTWWRRVYLVPHLIYGTDWTCNGNPDITDLFQKSHNSFLYIYTSCVDLWINYHYTAFHFILELILCLYVFKFLHKNRQPENQRCNSFFSFTAAFLLLFLSLKMVLVLCLCIFVLMTSVPRGKVYAKNKLISMVFSKWKFKCSDLVLSPRQKKSKLCWPK